MTDQKVWRLYLASRYVATEGPLKLYRTIEDTLREEGIPISTWDVAVTNTKHEMVHGWRRRQRGHTPCRASAAASYILSACARSHA